MPLEDDRIYDVLVKSSTSSDIAREIDKQGLEVFDGKFVVNSGGYDDNNNLDKLSSDFPNTRIVIVVIQSSSFIMIIVSPAFASLFMSEWKKEYFQIAISVSFYSFLELIDAFELIDEVIDNIDFYVDKPSLINAILAFVSVALLILPFSHFAFAGTDRTGKLKNHAKIVRNFKVFIVVLINAPFLIIRSRIVSIYGALDSDNSSLVSFILIFKELAMILIAIAEIIIEWKFGEDDSSNQAQSDRTSNNKVYPNQATTDLPTPSV